MFEFAARFESADRLTSQGPWAFFLDISARASQFATGLGRRKSPADKIDMSSGTGKSELNEEGADVKSTGAKLAQGALSELKKRSEQTVDAAQLEKIRSASTTPVSGTPVARRTPRRPFQRAVGVLVGGHYEVLRARQLSEGGMSIFMGEFGSRLRIKVEEVNVGQKLCMTFLLPSGQILSLLGEVIYHDTESGSGLHLGVKFGTVPLQQRRLIRAYVSSKKVGEKVQA